MREAMEQHRANAICAVLPRAHGPDRLRAGELRRRGQVARQGRRRADRRLGQTARTASQFEGPAGLKKLLLSNYRDEFDDTVTEKLLTYALGRGLEYYDKPAVRSIMRAGRARQLPHVGADQRHREEHPISDEEDSGTMIITKKSLPRRTFLRGLGTTLALPLLDSMIPALSVAECQPKPPVRLGFVYHPVGMILDKWMPATEGTGFEFTPTMKALEPFREHLTVFTGLAQVQRPRAGRWRGRPCARGRHLADRRPSQEDRRRRHPRRHLGRPDRRAANWARTRSWLRSNSVWRARRWRAAATPGYSCAYTNTVSWRDSHHAAAGGSQSARRVRTPVRRWREHRSGGAPGRAQGAAQHSRLRRRQHRPPGNQARQERPQQAQRVPGSHPRYRAAHPEGRAAERRAEDPGDGAPRAPRRKTSKIMPS